MSTSSWPSKVVPAQLAFLAIFNPSLGPTDDTFEDQLVFYFSRAALDARAAAKKNARNDAAGGDSLRKEENEKLRQIGLAQGMVDFAKSFSAGEPVDSVETERSRIVLHELEKGWWILASVDLTRLPAISQSSTQTSSKSTEKADEKSAVEYSAREVSPPALLIQQLIQAHCIFCLHHGPSLSDLFVRLTRDKFCNTLDRFWTRFARVWDVLLHGNPAADVFSGVKLASGGELGFGVGEEEWGSGEREVLEDLARRTEGLVDLVVARFGEPASAMEDKSSMIQEDIPPWLGSGQYPIASDGVIFSGMGCIQRHSLRDISLWMRQIYTYGEQAYGVKDNPLRERRKRRRRNPPESTKPANGDPEDARSLPRNVDPAESNRVPLQNRTAKRDNADERVDEGQANIPPPVVSAAAQALRKATHETGQITEQRGTTTEEAVAETSSTLGIPDQYMKYLTFGLSTLGTSKRPSTSRRSSAASSRPPKSDTGLKPSRSNPSTIEEENGPLMTHVEPLPDGEQLKSKIAMQKRQENRGHFIIGLKGDLLELDDLSEDDQTELSDTSFGDGTDGSRIVLRTLQVEVVPEADPEQDNDREGSEQAYETPMFYRRLRILLYVHRPFMYCFLFSDRTSSLQWTKFYKSLHRNLVPIHKPLLSSTSVDKVMQRIESSRVIAAEEEDTSESAAINSLRSKTSSSSPIYDLIYDPRRLTVHTSIPNIPEPGTPAAEGIFTSLSSETLAIPAWTRIEALNVHSQILSTLASVKSRPNDLERTSKTSRGWWIAWLRLPPVGEIPGREEVENEAGPASSKNTMRSDAYAAASTVGGPAMSTNEEEDQNRIAFLVRKASDATIAAKPLSTGSRAMSSMLEVMSLGMASRDDDNTGGPSAGWGPAALGGGIGIDARKYVEGLLSLNR